MMLLGWLTGLLLVLLAYRMLAGWPVPRLEQPLLAACAIWFALIMTGHTLSLFGALNQGWFYSITAVAWLVGGIATMRRLGITAQPQPLCTDIGLTFAQFHNPKYERWLTWAMLGLLGLAACCSFILVCNNMPGNADSISYRLPRAFWYVSHGSLMHPFDNVDRRTIFYPLNGTLLYVPLVLYGFPGTFHNLPTYLAWLVIVLTCYRFIRELGAPRSLSLLATVLVMLTPNILVQAAATNDEILCGGALLLALYMLLRWTLSGQRFYLLLAAMMAGISIGTKLHIVFYLPVVALGTLMLVIAALRHQDKTRQIWRQVGWRTLLGCIGLGSGMIAPFLLYNYASTGRFYFTDEFAGDFFNTHGRLQVVWQNLIIYSAQLVFAPLADLYGASDGMVREHFHAALNGFFAPLITPQLSADAADYHLQYRFKGVTIGVSPYYLEYSLWAGFSFLLAPLLWWQAVRQRHTALGYPLLLLCCAPAIWFLTWCSTTLYMEGTPTYLAYYLIAAAPIMLFALLAMRSRLGNALRWGLIATVLLTHCVIDFNTYRFNEFRNIPRLTEAARVPYDWELMDQSVVNEIESAKKIQIAFTRWGMSYFGIMQRNPHAFYYGPQEDVPDPAQTLSIFSVPSAQFWGFAPIYLPHKPSPGATFIGKMRGWGPEGVFAVGNDVARRWPDRNRYLVFLSKLTQAADGTHIQIAPYTPGYRDPDAIEVRYEVWQGDRLVTARDWATDTVWATVARAIAADAPPPLIRILVRYPGMEQADASYDLDLRAVREWTDGMIGVTPWLELIR